MIKKVYTLESTDRSLVVDARKESLPGSLQNVRVLPTTAEIKARILSQERGLAVDVHTDFAAKERELWGNSSRYVKTKDGRSAIEMDDEIILEQG